MGRVGSPPVSELRRDFGLEPNRCVRWPVGFESECWIADERWFIKVWNDDEHPVDLGVLDALADAALPVPRPLRSDVTRTDNGRPYAVFPYVRGRHATAADGVEVARLLRRVHDLPTDHLVLPTPLLSDEPLRQLRSLLPHPWVADRADELAEWLDRFEVVLARARATTVPSVLSHDDLDGENVLIGDDGKVVAALDWDWARLGPREHDLWTVIDHEQPRRFLEAYRVDDVDLDPTHLEFGLLRRALGDLAARVVRGVDRAGVITWGFDRLARVDDTLALF
jgi:Ser/Thr protein kinase RdoA (MazF antagonist)